MHDVASMGSSERKHRSYHPRSALQKLLSMVEPIMRPLTIELYETEKEEYASSQHSIDEIICHAGQRNSFQQFLRARETESCSFVKEFQFLCLCKEFREWGDKLQYGPYRIRVLANYIYHNFIREGGAQSLALSDVIRRNIERMRNSVGKVNSALFEEAYQYVSMVIIQQNVVKSFVESHYYQTMWEDEEMDCNLFKALSLGGAASLHTSRHKPFAGGSVGSSDASSCSSSVSRYSRTNFFGDGLSSEASSAIVSEIQSIASSKSGSSKSSTGSNASAAFDKYYSSKNSQMKSNKKKGVVNPAKLMEELLPRLEIISLEQSMRVQNFGSLDQGPHGGDTPVVVLMRNKEREGEEEGPVDMGSLNHMTHHSLPQQMVTSTLQPFTQPPQQPPPSSSLYPSSARPSDKQQCVRERSASTQSVEAMVCDEEEPVVRQPEQHVAMQPEQQPSEQPARPAWTEQTTQQSTGSGQARSSDPNRAPDVQIAYTYSTDSICYVKVLPGPNVTLQQFKEVVAWNNPVPNSRYFFKRQLPGIGEVHEEISLDSSSLPFWAPNTIFGRVERGLD